MENLQTPTVSVVLDEHPISSSEGEEEVQMDPLEATTDSNISICMPEPPSTQEMWTSLEQKFATPKKKSCLKRKAKSTNQKTKIQKEVQFSAPKISTTSGQRS